MILYLRISRPDFIHSLELEEISLDLFSDTSDDDSFEKSFRSLSSKIKKLELHNELAKDKDEPDFITEARASMMASLMNMKENFNKYAEYYEGSDED